MSSEIFDTGMLSIELATPKSAVSGVRPARAAESIDDVMVRALRKESVEPNKAETHAETASAAEGVRGEPSSGENWIQGADSSSPPEGGASGWAALVTQVLAIALVASCLTLLALKFSGLLRPPQVRVVTFDVLKYENAERDAAMKLMGQGGSGSVAPMLSYVSKRLRSAIRQAAGPDTLVVLSQAVVQGQTRDITDQVLKNLGLPTNVPTAAPIQPAALAPSTIAPPIKASVGSPLSRLVNSGAHTKAPSIVP